MNGETNHHDGSIVASDTVRMNSNGDDTATGHQTNAATKKPTRTDIKSLFTQFASLIHASQRPMPSQTGDGSYVTSDEHSGLLNDLGHIGWHEVQNVAKILESAASGKPQNDREYSMEALMQVVAALPHASKNRVDLTAKFVNTLWTDLQHPPLSYLGDDFKYRSGDGSNNNYVCPQLGAAYTPYARSVNPVTVTPAAPPDPFLIFDAVMARQDFKPHPNKVSSIFFAWASLIIHDCFQTDHKDFSVSKTSSYIDLSTLYGDTQKEQDKIRLFKDGKLKPDCFSEERLLAFPPAAGVILIMLNRFHNHVVEHLALINEGGRFTKPSDRLTGQRREDAWKKYDNDLFQTGRLVTCGLYANITLFDYLRTIVNLNRSNTTWNLDPRMRGSREDGHTDIPWATGNQVSAEFALCYRWHSCIGQSDEEWIETVYQELFHKKPEDVDFRELMIGLGKYDNDLSDDPLERPFAHLKRGPDGKFDDGDLARIMTEGIEQISGAFGARNTPKAMRAISALAIKQARSWNLCTFNEFRAFFGLKKFETFEEINPDPEIAQQLRNLYEHPDYVELYPGIMIEETKTPMIPGVGICPNHTLARAILADAVTLVRGDRFYTVDYNAKNLTNWGYQEVAYDLNINQGCLFYKLMLKALPNHFHPDSIYAHYPMTVPDENANIMKDLGRFDDFNWDRPRAQSPRILLTSYANSKYLLEHDQDFKVMWNEGLRAVLGNDGEHFCLGGDTVFHKKQRETMATQMYREKWRLHVKHFYEYITTRLIHEKSSTIAGINQVDITRDVGNIAHVHFAANMFNLPLKTEENPKGIFSEHELWMALAVIFAGIFLDFEPTKSFPLRKAANKLAQVLGGLAEMNVKTVTATSFAPRFFDSFRENANPLAAYGIHMIRALADTGMPAHELVYSQILPTAGAMVPNQSQVFTQLLDYYLGEGNQHLPDIQKWAALDTPEADDKLLHYVQEGIRLNGTFGIYRRAAVGHTFEEHGKQVHVNPGDKVFCSFVSAARDASVFPNPNVVELNRPLDSYLHYGIGPHTCLGKEMSQIALTAMLRVVGRLPGLRRAPGPQGELKKLPRPGGFFVYMRECQESLFPFPCTMKVHYDGQIPAKPTAAKE